MVMRKFGLEDQENVFLELRIEWIEVIELEVVEYNKEMCMVVVVVDVVYFLIGECGF